MKNKYYLIVGILIIMVIIVSIYIYNYTNPYDYSEKEREKSCINSGGIVKTISCCNTIFASNTSKGIIGINFVDTCEWNLTSVCNNCSSENISFELNFCDCGEEKCQDRVGNCIVRPSVYGLPQ
jgi:hypothetical protein